MDRRSPQGQQIEMEVDQDQIESAYHTLDHLGLCLIGCLHRIQQPWFDEMEAQIKAKEDEIAKRGG